MDWKFQRFPCLLRLVCTVSLAGFASLCWGQESGFRKLNLNPNQKATAGAYSVSGVVVNSVTGEPIARALVQIAGAVDRAALTNPEGSFELDELPQGQSTISAQKPGFFGEELFQFSTSGTGSAANSTIEVGPDSRPVTLKLAPLGVIRGRVESNGEPLEDVPVKAFLMRIQDGRRQIEPAAFVKTDENGEFRLANLFPGAYYLLADPNQEGSRGRGRKFIPEDSYARAFYPGAQDAAGAALLNVSPGQQLEVSLSLTKGQVFQVSGLVTGVPAGAGLGFRILDWTGEGISLRPDFDAASGKFHITLSPGSYTLVGFANGNQGMPALGKVPLVVNGDVVGVHLVLAASSSVAVKVRTEPPSSAPPFRKQSGMTFIEATSAMNVRASSEDASPVNLRLVPLDYSRGFLGGVAGLDGKESLISDLLPDSYSTVIDAPPPWYVEAASCDGVDLLRNDLVVAGGAALPPMEIAPRKDGGMVSGTLTWEDRPDQSDSDGTFTLRYVLPGTYTLLALSKGWDMEWSNPAVLQPYLKQGQTVQVQGSQKADVKVTVQ